MCGQATFATWGWRNAVFVDRVTAWSFLESFPKWCKSSVESDNCPVSISQRGQCSQCIFAAKNRTRVLQGDGKCIMLRKGCCTSERFWNLSNSEQTPKTPWDQPKPIEIHSPYNNCCFLGSRFHVYVAMRSCWFWSAAPWLDFEKTEQFGRVCRFSWKIFSESFVNLSVPFVFPSTSVNIYIYIIYIYML